ncbi:MAG: rubrerythrin family protein [Syntrophales bacterium]
MLNKTIKGSITEQNVALAFANESMTVSRYSFFSRIAYEEELNQAGDAFAEISEDEKRHAATLFKLFAGGTVELNLSIPLIPAGSTPDNIANSVKLENAAWNIRYPEFAKKAADEGFLEIAEAFKKFAHDEKRHEQRFKMLLSNLSRR